MTLDLGDKLISAIKNKDPKESLSIIQEYHVNMKGKDDGAEYIAWITDPVNLSLVHKLLIDDLQIPPRVLAIKRILMSRPQRAALLVRAIEQSIKKVHNL